MRFGRIVFAAALFCVPALADLPPGFISQTVIADWDLATGVTFAPDGRGFVWEKGGRVWLVEDGVKSAQPLIDIHDEVGNWRDYGLLGFAIDPDFYNNGYIYLLYVVDYYHLTHFGQPDYDPDADEYFHDTIGRLTRYTCNAADGFRSVDYSSRLVLVGESISTGFPHLHQSHGVGMVFFGEDGSLMATCGDGASYSTIDDGGFNSGSSNTGLADGIITLKEDVGAYRSQLVDSLSGKVIRIDPATGDGLPDNPFYDAAEPRAPRSRVWALGLRNPFRAAIRPGTGQRHHFPGVIYIGDVGWNLWEDLNVCKGPGVNFGWPVYEGMDLQNDYATRPTANQDAPNPLFGMGGCTQEFFTFHDLIVQDTLDPNPSWPNPCDPGQQIPATIPRFVHKRPAIDWRHGSGPSRGSYYVGFESRYKNLADPNSPIPGPNFGGNTSTAGVWYTGASFPPEYHNTFFHGDYVSGWVRNFVFDENNDAVLVRDFASEGSIAVVCMALHPIDGDLYYIDYDDSGTSRLGRFRYVSDNLPPIAVAAVDPQYGPIPLTVQFTGSESSDPEGQSLTFEWDFGDGTPPSRLPDPLHTYLLEDISAQGTITARIFMLNPPHPLGGGNWDPDVIRDGDYPPTGSDEPLRQYDTFHNGDQGAIDFIGYIFDEPRELRGLVFLEGMHFDDGGWFDTLRVQKRIGNDWTDVTNLVVRPVYAGDNGVNYEMYEFTFDPVTATGLRLFGNPGGSASFISVGELRVLATPLAPPTGPQRYDATLTVRDGLGGQASASAFVSPNNTPPLITITSPVDGSLFPMDQETILPLEADISDAEHGPSELSCSWQTILHHDDHTHPEPPVDACSTTTVITPVGCDGHVYFYELQLTVTDAHGLSSSASAFVYPDCSTLPCIGDLNFDQVIDLGDLSILLAHFGESGNVHYADGDLDSDGDVDLADLSTLLAAFGTTCD